MRNLPPLQKKAVVAWLSDFSRQHKETNPNLEESGIDLLIKMIHGWRHDFDQFTMTKDDARNIWDEVVDTATRLGPPEWTGVALLAAKLFAKSLSFNLHMRELQERVYNLEQAMRRLSVPT